MDALLGHFAEKRSIARRRYGRFVSEGRGQGSIWSGLSQQIDLGDERFVKRMQGRAGGGSDDVNIPKVQRRGPPPSRAQIEAAHESRVEAVVAAYQTGGYSYQQIATHFGLHFTTVGRYVRAASQGKASRGQTG